MKTLKFAGSKPELILKGLKGSTWRISDEKNIAEGDTLSLCRLDGSEFAKAEVTLARETSIRELLKADMQGHEKLSEGEAIRRLSGYYRMKVMPQTVVKAIKFKVIGR